LETILRNSYNVREPGSRFQGSFWRKIGERKRRSIAGKMNQREGARPSYLIEGSMGERSMGRTRELGTRRNQDGLRAHKGEKSGEWSDRSMQGVLLQRDPPQRHAISTLATSRNSETAGGRRSQDLRVNFGGRDKKQPERTSPKRKRKVRYSSRDGTRVKDGKKKKRGEDRLISLRGGGGSREDTVHRKK